MKSPDLLNAALAHHGLGRPVIPVQADKRPACEAWGRWRYEAQSEAEVRDLFSRPVHGLALLTWPGSDLMVLDFDGPHAEQTWTEKTGITLPDTATNRTRSGGVHRIYRTPKDTPRPDRTTIEQGPRRKVRLAVNPECGCEKPCGVDLLVNGYFLVPPSPGYAEDPDAPCEPGSITTIPQAILALARTTERQNGEGQPQSITPGAPISDGERNKTLTSLAGSMRRRGMTQASILAALLEENAQRCTPPLPERDIRTIAASVSKYQPAADGTKDTEPRATEKETQQEAPPADVARDGDDFTYTWPTLNVRVLVSRLRDSGEGVYAEISVSLGGKPGPWGRTNLASFSARKGLVEALGRIQPKVPWREMLEEVCRETARRFRAGEPFVTLTGVPTATTRELLPRFLYEGEPTLLYGDGDTGKSLAALALAAAVHAGIVLPCGLKPVRPVPAAYLDWETSRDTLEARLGLLAAGWGVTPPPILYKRMTRPLADEAVTLAAEFARRGIGLVVVDSKMFAVGAVEGAFHEPITAFYNALRLFAPAASLVLNHVTGAEARGTGPARPFGGAFAFNAPRLIYEARRDPDITDATAIAFTCRKANNLPRRPDPFGLRFEPSEGAIRVRLLDLTEAAPQTVAGATLPYRIRLTLAAQGTMTTPEIAKAVGISDASARTTLRRMEAKDGVENLDPADGEKATRWRLTGP